MAPKLDALQFLDYIRNFNMDYPTQYAFYTDDVVLNLPTDSRFIEGKKAVTDHYTDT